MQKYNIINLLAKSLKKEIKSLNFIISLIIGQIFSIICLRNSIISMNEKNILIDEVNIWGNTIYPRSVANSCICLYREQDLLILYLITLFFVFVLRFRNIFTSDSEGDIFKRTDYKCNPQKYIVIKSVSMFFYGFVSSAVTLFSNLILTLCFIPVFEPYRATWEFASFESDVLLEIYQNNFLIYVVTFQILICLIAGLVVQTTVFWDYLTLKIKLLNILGKILFAVLIIMDAFVTEKINLFIYIDPNNQYGKQTCITYIILVLLIVNVVENILMYRKNHKSLFSKYEEKVIEIEE